MQINSPTTDSINQSNGEISLIDIARFLKKNWKMVLQFAVFGGIVATVYISIIPKKYEAITYIKLPNPIILDDKFPIYYPIASLDPKNLILKMKYPTFYANEVRELCGLPHSTASIDVFSNKINVTIEKDNFGLIKLTIIDESIDRLQTCSSAIFGLIKSSQDNLVRLLSKELQNEIHSEELLMTTLSDSFKSSGFDKNFLIYSEANFHIRLSYNLKKLKYELDRARTELFEPTFINQNPVSSPKKIIFFLGLFVGGIIGIIFSIIKSIVFKITALENGKQSKFI